MFNPAKSSSNPQNNPSKYPRKPVIYPIGKNMLLNKMRSSLWRYLKYKRQLENPFPDEAPIEARHKLVEIIEAGLTLGNPIKLWSTYSAMAYVEKNEIAGDFVEVGCWKAGHLIAALRGSQSICSVQPRDKKKYRKFHGYDLFDDGFANIVRDPHDVPTKTRDATLGHVNNWSDLNSVMLPHPASIVEVESSCRKHFQSHSFELHQCNLNDRSSILSIPENIAVLRIDCDFYSPSLTSLELFYPNLARGGVLILDDYGHWEGAKLATDEYFRNSASSEPLLFFQDSGSRAGIKI